MKESVSKIKKSTFSNDWKNPSGGTTYYFDIVMENGDSGSVGVSDRNSEKVREGVELTYTILNGKIKIVNASTGQTKLFNGFQGVKKTKASQEQFLGFSWSYAKDLIVAGKGMKDVEELNKVARYIYEQIGDMLQSDQ